MCFEKVNGLPTSKFGCSLDKVIQLRHIWSKLNADLMSLVETHINKKLFLYTDPIHKIMLRNQLATSMLSDNENELIGRRQQGGAITEAQVEIDKHKTSTGADSTRLDRWN